MKVLKEFNTRISHKHDTEANWQHCLSFIPLNGEIIIYDPDENYNYPRVKLGNGNDYVSDLPFVYENRLLDNTNKINLLAYHNPDCIKVEYTNNNGGWKLDLRDADNNVIEHRGQNMFAQPHTNEVNHEIEFSANGITNANLSVYSMTSHPGEFFFRNVTLETKSIQGPSAFELSQIYNAVESEWSGWNPTWTTSRDGDSIILNTDGSWNGLLTQNFEVGENAICSLSFSVGQITGDTGVNFKIIDANGTTIKNFSNKNISAYLAHDRSQHQNYTYVFCAPTPVITINFSGPGNYIPGTCQLNDLKLQYVNEFYESCEDSSSKQEWLTGDSWYSPSFTNDEAYSGGQSIRLTANQGYWGYIKRQASIVPNVPYKCSFWVKSAGGVCNATIKTDNGTSLFSKTIYAEATNTWTYYDCRFISNTRNISIQFQLDGEFSNNMFYFDEIRLQPVEYQSPLLNGNFSELEVKSDGTITNKARYWDFLYSQSYVEDGKIHLMPVDDKQYSPGLSQSIILHPQGTYKLTFKTQRISRSYVWKPYSTMMPKDKVALVTGQPGYVPARIQSPWGNTFSPDHQMRITIMGDPQRMFAGFYRALEFTAQIASTDKFYVQVETSFDNVNYELDGTYEFSSLGAIQSYIVPFNKGLGPWSIQSLSVCLSIRLTFFTKDNNQGEDKEDIIYHVYAYGTEIYTLEDMPSKEFVADANGNVIFTNKVITPQLVAIIDDGSIDF